MAAPAVDEAFERLYSSYGREVYRYALALLRNPSEAEDATQTTFLNAYRALRAGERPRRPHNWLIAIAHNACRSRVRFAMRRPKEVPLDDVVEQLAVPEAEGPNIRELLRTMKQLPSSQRAAISMRELEGRSYVDIAERLGVTVPAAEALIGRARRTLRAQAARFRTLALLPSAAAKIAALLAVGAIGAGFGVATGTDPRAAPAPIERNAPHDREAVAGSSSASGERAPTIESTERAAGAGVLAATSLGARPQIAADGASSAGPATSASAAGTTAAGPTTEAATEATTVVTKKAATVVTHLPTLSTPSATTPSATTPPVTTPSVTTPVATVPPVTVPSVTVPAVTVPPPTVTVPPLP
jgi:RNA polymerase sigma factor (sigma-70 family)